MKRLLAVGLLLTLASGCAPAPHPAGSAPAGSGVQALDLVELWNARRLRAVHRSVEPLQPGTRRGVRLDEGEVPGMAWIEGVEFGSGVIEVDVRGRNVPQRSFVGLAFHGVDDTTYDAVYLRPFNFRSEDPVQRSHAVQYISLPTHTWRKLREEHPGVYEQPIDPAPDPESWVHLRLALAEGRVSVHVNGAQRPALVVEQLSRQGKGRVGLWVGNPSDGEFSNLRITHAPRDALAPQRLLSP